MLYLNMLKTLIFLIISSIFIGCNDTPKINTDILESPLMVSIKPDLSIKKGRVKRGQGLYQALKSVSIDNKLALSLINELRDEVEFSKLKVGDELIATFKENKLISFSLSQNLFENHIVTLNSKSGQWDYSLKTLDTFWEPRIIEGNLRSGSSLESDLIALGLKRSVVNEVVNVLLCKVNFRMYAREGDRYKILLNERKHNEKIVSTKVLFTSYQGARAGTHEAFLYEDKEKSSTYTAHYTESGQALINSGLRYPLSRLHVRSGYGWRRHPVTGKRAMHRGVDLRGRTGSKVHAVASGKVIISTYNKYAGNKIAIRHRDGSTSFYFHLSKRGVNVGSWVKSHQVIGRVGATGRVTGAHLHFGFKNSRGKWMNPLNKRMIATPRLSGTRFINLSAQIGTIRGTIADLHVSKESKYLIANLDNIRRSPSSHKDFNHFLKEWSPAFLHI